MSFGRKSCGVNQPDFPALVPLLVFGPLSVCANPPEQKISPSIFWSHPHPVLLASALFLQALDLPGENMSATLLENSARIPGSASCLSVQLLTFLWKPLSLHFTVAVDFLQALSGLEVHSLVSYLRYERARTLSWSSSRTRSASAWPCCKQIQMNTTQKRPFLSLIFGQELHPSFFSAPAHMRITEWRQNFWFCRA